MSFIYDSEETGLPDLDDASESTICPACSGSGEGMYDGDRCALCKGCGEVAK